MNAGLEVRLTLPELRHAAYVAIDRFVRAMSQGRSASYGVTNDDILPDVLGAWGECVVAKVIDSYWTGDIGRPDQGAADVGPFHVRTTKVPTGHLILHDADRDDEPFVLVILRRLPVFEIAGWCHGRVGKVPEYWSTTTGRPAYFVPQSALAKLDQFDKAVA